MSVQNPTYTKLTDRGVSFGVLRTNPKLTSNLKLTIDSLGDLWFNSIDATSELAQNKYKNYAIGPNSNHEINIFKFYDTGKTPSKIAFAIGSTITVDTIAKDLKDQFDFDLYSSGAKYLSSKNYKEKFSFLAPLYLDTVLPECFVILKVPGASNYTVGEWKQIQTDPTFTKTKFALDLFRNASIVKTFMLTENTKAGTYIRNILRNPMYPKNPLYVNFKEDRYSVYRGASISSGTYVEIPELLSATLRRSIPQLKLEKYITEGFERNNLIYPRLLNLEFLFDDDTSEPYTFNRYIGFYCNLIDVAEFDIDISSMYENSSDNDNPLSFNYRHEDEVSINITNSNGVILRGIGVDLDLTAFDDALTNENSMFFPYLKLRDDSLSFPKVQSMEQINNQIKFTISENTLDLGLTFGPGELFSQETAKPATVNTRSTVSISFIEKPEHLDTLRVYHTNGSTFDRNDSCGSYDDLVFVDDDSVFLNNEAYIISYPEIVTITFDTENPNIGVPTFSPNLPEVLGNQYISNLTSDKWIWNGSAYIKEAVGSRIYINVNNANIGSTHYTDLAQLAKTVITVIKNLKNSFLTGKTFENIAFLQVFPFGNKYGQLAIRLLGDFSNRAQINRQNTSSTVYADGGFYLIQQAILPIDNIARLTPILDQIVVKTEKDWSKIKRVCHSSISIEDPILTEKSVDLYFSNGTLILEDNEPTDITYDRIEIRKIFKPALGVLSLFEMKDMDFYTYSSQYTKIPEIDLYQYYYIPKDIKILDFTKYAYDMIGSGTISINGIQYSTQSGSQTIWQNLEGLHQYSVITGDVILIQSNKLPENHNIIRQDIAIFDEDENFTNFTGFFALGADHSSPSASLPTYNYREKYKTNNLLSEYHVYLENFDKEFAVDGRIIPYISKWGILESTDARGNQYRLNSDIMFGKDNFGPSHHETSPTSEKLTHEWFYIESDFNYSLSADLLKKNYFYFNQPFDIELMINDSTYFERYFTYIPTLSNREIGRPQFRYSKLNRDQFTNQYSTVFNGAKFIFSELFEDGKINTTTDRFADYNFSILLKPVKEDLLNQQDPIKYRIIENTDAKSIVILIEMPIGDVSDINSRLLQDTIWQTSDGETLQFKDRRLDQTNLFLDGLGILSEIKSTEFQITKIYISENSAAGDALFNSLLTSGYPSFSNIDFLNGYMINAKTEIGSGSFPPPVDSDILLIRKGSDTTKQFIVAFANSEIFTMASSGKLQSGSRNLIGTPIDSDQYFSISTPRLGYLQNTASLFRIIQDSNLGQQEIRLSTSNSLVISISLPGFLSMFGDYRISFNELGVSNLTYNFLYAAKDKKYSSTKAAYSTTKLAVGVDLSLNSYSETDTNYFLDAKPLNGQKIPEFKLEDFINPISGSHDTFTNLELNSILNPGDPSITSPLPAFAPLMFINKVGEVSFLLSTAADFTLDRFNTELQLINPNLTTHAILRVSDNLLTLDRPTDKETILLKIKFDSDPIEGAIFNLNKQQYPAQSPAYWLNDNSQFQLFGGKDYFANLFESISFANFVLLLQNSSQLISWETYQNGQLLNGQKIVIQIEEPDLVEKSTIIVSTPETVSTASKTSIGGFSHTEEQSTAYEVYRYSGEYDIVYHSVSGFKQNVEIGPFTLSGANVFLNPEITDFFVIPEFSFVKYSDFNILDFENSEKFEPLYPMIYESPIDFDSYSVLSSSWDLNYHYVYSTKKDRIKIPGSRRISEDYSFVSKLLNVPLSFVTESFNAIELTNQQFEMSDSDFLKLSANGTSVDFAYSAYSNEIRFKINFAQVMAKSLSETDINGNPRLRVEFQKFFVDAQQQPILRDLTFLGDLTFDQYLYQYCKTNLLNLYMLDSIDFYGRPNYTIGDNSINILEIPYDQLDNAGYSEVKSVKINNPNSDIITGSILKNISSGISLVPKLKIKYI